jgi:translation initiation factor IF-2
MIPVSAHTGFGIDDLLEIILLVAEMKELKANPNRSAIATVLESHLDTKL